MSVKDGLSVIDEDVAGVNQAAKSDWLPDFGAPVATRDRAQYNEPTGGTHYSDTEDEEEHKRRDFVHSNAAHFSRISEFDKKTKKKKKKKKDKTVTQPKVDTTVRRHSRTKSETLVGTLVGDVIHEESKDPIQLVDDAIVSETSDQDIWKVPNNDEPRVSGLPTDSAREHIIAAADTAHSTHRHIHKKVKKVKLEERRRPGDQVGETTHHDTTNDDGLREIDIEDANAHRFDDVPGIRKHIIHRHCTKWSIEKVSSSVV